MSIMITPRGLVVGSFFSISGVGMCEVLEKMGKLILFLGEKPQIEIEMSGCLIFNFDEDEWWVSQELQKELL